MVKAISRFGYFFLSSFVLFRVGSNLTQPFLQRCRCFFPKVVYETGKKISKKKIKNKNVVAILQKLTCLKSKAACFFFFFISTCCAKSTCVFLRLSLCSELAWAEVAWDMALLLLRLLFLLGGASAVNNIFDCCVSATTTNSLSGWQFGASLFKFKFFTEFKFCQPNLTMIPLFCSKSRLKKTKRCLKINC